MVKNKNYDGYDMVRIFFKRIIFILTVLFSKSLIPGSVVLGNQLDKSNQTQVEIDFRAMMLGSLGRSILTGACVTTLDNGWEFNLLGWILKFNVSG